MELKDLSAMVDAFYETRDKRLEADRVAEKLKKEETNLKAAIISALNINEVGSIGGTLCRVTLKRDDKPVCEDWPALYAYIRERNEFDLLHKRITEGAVKLRWEEGIVLPGVVKFPLLDLTVSKL